MHYKICSLKGNLDDIIEEENEDEDNKGKQHKNFLN